MKLYSAAQSQQLDRLAIDRFGFPGILLMKRAAFRAFQTLRQHWPQAKNVCVLCGTGNNGGDGLALAQYALIQGLSVDIVLTGSPDKLKPDAAEVYRELIALGVTPQAFCKNALNDYDVIVDALLGIGINAPITGKLVEIIDAVNTAETPVLALDMPSGIDATNGQIHGCAIQADITISFICHKPGLYTGLGAGHIGHFVVDNLDLPIEVFSATPSLADFHDLTYWQTKRIKRTPSAHKGTAGTVLLIGGNHSMGGAIQLAATATLRAGTGLTKVITQPDNLIKLTQEQPELMTYPPSQLSTLITEVDALAIGPGLGLDSWAQDLFQQTLNAVPDFAQPLVMDADALKLLAQTNQLPENPNWVLTPHPGEAAVMLNFTTQEIQHDRFSAIQKLQEKYGGVIVLKGNGTLIFDGKQMELCPLGNPGMAVGGMGDVLTGMIASYLAQGMNLIDAACLGVYQHAAIADQIIEHQSLTSLIPSDIIARL